MFKHFLVNAIFLATIANASASLIGSTTVFRRRLLNDIQLNNIQRRQGISLSDFPAECQPGCSLAVNTYNMCDTVDCLCTQAVDTSFQECIDCVLQSSVGAEFGSDAAQIVAAYNVGCAGTGVSSLSIGAGATATAPGSSTSTTHSAAHKKATSQTDVPTVSSTPKGTTIGSTPTETNVGSTPLETIITSTSTQTAVAVTTAPATTTASGASSTSARGVGLLSIAVTFLAVLMA